MLSTTPTFDGIITCPECHARVAMAIDERQPISRMNVFLIPDFAHPGPDRPFECPVCETSHRRLELNSYHGDISLIENPFTFMQKNGKGVRFPF